MDGLRDIAQHSGIPLRVTGFGAALALHFGNDSELRDYRDSLSDDRETLGRFLMAALSEGLHMLPDGRMYVSAAHTERDIAETLVAASHALEAACHAKETLDEIVHSS
ncbi:Glutamate-1-semialdehyde-2,1-aminomutase (fragment) [Candidatus Sulfopaludibacter sp. SbA3]